MTSNGAISKNAFRVLWVALLVFWASMLVAAVAAKRGGAPDSYHNQYSRQISLDTTELLLTLVFLISGVSRLRGQWRYALMGTLFAGAIVALVATGRLAA